jgi:hypothetical protein
VKELKNTHSEGLDIIHGKIVSAEVEEGILEHATMSVTIFRQSRFWMSYLKSSRPFLRKPRDQGCI